ncbi:MAG: autotransporter outer membrane beta-barrel domain-containing protein, partial [Rhizomicrobium sp.]
TSAVGIRADQGHTGDIVIANTIDMTGSGSGKTAIQIGNASVAGGTFTGINDTTNNPNAAAGTLSAIILDSGATVKVQGDGSTGIHLLSTNTLHGDILIAGAIQVLPTNANSTTSSGTNVGVQLDGPLTGNLTLDSSGSVRIDGPGAEGAVVLGQLTGSVENLGFIGAIGTDTPKTGGGNPVSGSGLVISNNVTGGIYNGGPLLANDGTTTATLVSDGGSPTLQIEPGFDSIAAAPITIGTFTDLGGAGAYSLINRGAITSSPINPTLQSTAILIAGTSAANSVTLTGIYNAGTISGAATNDVNLANGTVVPVVGLNIAGFAKINPVNGWAITNSNATGAGLISATVSGQRASAAFAINIAPNGTVPSLNNSGTISAAASVTDTTVNSIVAYGVFDQSGTLLNLNNSGTIKAVATAVVNGTTAVPLDNHGNLARAVYLGAATAPITFTNTGTIVGDIVLGSAGDTLTTSGTATQPSNITGNINFGGGTDTLTVGGNSVVTGDILESLGGRINATVASGGVLTATNNGLTTDGVALPASVSPNIQVQNLTVQDGGTLGLTLSDAFNINKSGNAGPIVQANLNPGSEGTITLQANSVLKMNFGGFVSASNLNNAQGARFIVFDAASGHIIVPNATQIENDLSNGISFLFEGNTCAYGVTGFTPCTGTNPEGAGRSDVVLDLSPKTTDQLGLHGFAKAMFAPANEALGNDSTLGAAVVNAGLPVNGTKLSPAAGSALYQKIYSAFAPDVTGSERAIAISLTDQSSGIVGARQRALRMYAGQEGDATLWSQEFGQRLNVPNKSDASGYSNSGFGFALGMDGGDISSGRYGGALTFYAGDTSEKQPRESKTNSEWYMLTAYQDWRGRGLFFDSQLNVGYGHLVGKRTFPIPDADGKIRVAEGKRSSELASGGFTTGVIFNSGGTVFIPQLSVDALTMRQEGYTESGGGAGMDLHVQPSYANSLRAFLGADLRQDLKIGNYFLQPEARVGYRYDFLSGAEKLKALFAGDPSTGIAASPTSFSITGPDPSKGNLVVGGGMAITTDAWSIGLNYDYLRGVGGTGGTDQTAMLTLVGRI